MTDENIIVLYDEEESEAEFELLDLVNFEDEEYVVLLPGDSDEYCGEVVIFKLEYVDGEEGETYLRVEDEATLMAVYNIFKERFKDEFRFVD